MPTIRVVFFKDGTGNVPVLQWFDLLPAAVQDKLMDRIRRLGELGH